MEKDIEVKTTLYDRMKEENIRLLEKLQVNISIKQLCFYHNL
jgi:hypothetical protein